LPFVPRPGMTPALVSTGLLTPAFRPVTHY
jgi:hypothetical protein